MEKNFDGWNEVKKKTHYRTTRRLFHEREIWWCSFGINIGREQDGRADNFERPVIIIKTLSPDTFCVVPLSTKKKLEKFQSEIVHDTIRGFALLDQIRVLDSKRLLRKVGMVSQEEFDRVKKKLKEILFL